MLIFFYSQCILTAWIGHDYVRSESRRRKEKKRKHVWWFPHSFSTITIDHGRLKEANTLFTSVKHACMWAPVIKSHLLSANSFKGALYTVKVFREEFL